MIKIWLRVRVRWVSRGRVRIPWVRVRQIVASSGPASPYPNMAYRVATQMAWSYSWARVSVRVGKWLIILSLNSRIESQFKKIHSIIWCQLSSRR